MIFHPVLGSIAPGLLMKSDIKLTGFPCSGSHLLCQESWGEGIQVDSGLPPSSL